MFAQKNIEEAPAAIIYSLEGVFAVIAAWIILQQVLNVNNIIGCILILIAVIFSQLAPSIKKINKWGKIKLKQLKFYKLQKRSLKIYLYKLKRI